MPSRTSSKDRTSCSSTPTWSSRSVPIARSKMTTSTPSPVSPPRRHDGLHAHHRFGSSEPKGLVLVHDPDTWTNTGGTTRPNARRVLWATRLPGSTAGLCRSARSSRTECRDAPQSGDFALEGSANREGGRPHGMFDGAHTVILENGRASVLLAPMSSCWTMGLGCRSRNSRPDLCSERTTDRFGSGLRSGTACPILGQSTT